MPRKATPKLVTKESLIQMLNEAAPAKRKQIIGRALSAIYAYQTADEKAIQETVEHNGVGFSGPDAKIGSRCAVYYNENGTIGDWAVDLWMQDRGKGPKIAKYWKQLNTIAIDKAERKARAEAYRIARDGE